MALTIRIKPEQEKKIASLKCILGIASSSKLLLHLVDDYQAKIDLIDLLRCKIQTLEQDLKKRGE